MLALSSCKLTCLLPLFVYRLQLPATKCCEGLFIQYAVYETFNMRHSPDFPTATQRLGKLWRLISWLEIRLAKTYNSWNGNTSINQYNGYQCCIFFLSLSLPIHHSTGLQPWSTMLDLVYDYVVDLLANTMLWFIMVAPLSIAVGISQPFLHLRSGRWWWTMEDWGCSSGGPRMLGGIPVVCVFWPLY